MEIEFDPAKNERNILHRKLSFERAADFDFRTAVTVQEERKGEMRLVSVGYFNDRLHLLCYLETSHGIRVISFRRANAREAKKYGEAKAINR